MYIYYIFVPITKVYIAHRNSFVFGGSELACSHLRVIVWHRNYYGGAYVHVVPRDEGAEKVFANAVVESDAHHKLAHTLANILTTLGLLVYTLLM